MVWQLHRVLGSAPFAESTMSSPLWRETVSTSMNKIADSRISLSFKSTFAASKLRKENSEHINRWLIEEIPCSNRERYRAAILVDDTVVGEINFRNFEREVSPRECIISYWVDKSFWGRGVATKALKKASDYALQNLDVDIVVALIHELNLPSISTAKKAGYTLTGVRKIAMYENSNVELHLRYTYGNL